MGRSDDLEHRLFLFARRVRRYLKKLPRTLANREDSVQLIKASGSVGANYIEGREGVSTRDYFYRIKVCKKEVRESAYWLRLMDTGDDNTLEIERSELIAESVELAKIFWSICRKERSQ
jgi:four helix bundle protein